MCYDLIADDAEQEPVRRQPEKGESVPTTMDTVSYTHLDVYKRQLRA